MSREDMGFDKIGEFAHAMVNELISRFTGNHEDPAPYLDLSISLSIETIATAKA